MRSHDITALNTFAYAHHISRESCTHVFDMYSPKGNDRWQRRYLILRRDWIAWSKQRGTWHVWHVHVLVHVHVDVLLVMYGM